ncbi:E3 SUMO-protein ligase pli1 [Favolaschia claudopus]|uniref:E3 SUMO-protein ligase pli1 n=1 Tax=Favolaschia claudopus TaxID=2862362 RepID=A0AAW0E879_9AGAR
MSTPLAENPWADVDAVSKALPYGTAVDLKQIIISLNTECGTHMLRSGRKQELVDRLRDQFATWKRTNNVASWKRAKGLIDAIRLPTTSFTPMPPPVATPQPQSRSAPYPVAAPNPASIPLPPSRGPSTYNAPFSSNYNQGPRFKPSPFFVVHEAVSTVLDCPESFSATDRRECTLHFQINDNQMAKLHSPGAGYQLRLFCTSSKFYSPGSFNNVECPIEFPQTCEVYVNNIQLKTSLLKGIKKRPGTAPPPKFDIVNARNSVRMIYINGGQGNLEYKKYYLVAQLVKSVSVSALVDQLMKTRFISAPEIRRQMVSSMSNDEDIIAGSLKMSLKCPVCTQSPRSSKCTHSQCFDATSWYSMMEQTTTWLCPVCENVLDWKELIIDGFFAEILKMTPDSVDDVILEADGEWSTADQKYSSAKVAAGIAGPVEYDYIDSDSD